MMELYIFAGLLAIGLLLMWRDSGRPKEFNYPALREELRNLPPGTIITPVSVLVPPPKNAYETQKGKDTKMEAGTFKLVEDKSGCKHEFIVGPTRRDKNLLFGHCDACRREVAAELDKAGERTGRSWLIEYGPESK
jgi:hypothetical protein